MLLPYSKGVVIVYCWLFVNMISGRKLPLYESKEKGLECSTLLMKTLADLLLSEYNRVESTNQNLYLLSRDPYVLCNEYDESSCFISMEIQASECDRFSASKGCRVRSEMDTKTCFGFVDPYKIEIEKPLICQTDSEAPGESGKEFLQLQGFAGDFRSKLAEKIIKKQWGREYGGNIYPL